MRLHHALPAILVVAPALAGCLGPSLEEFQGRHGPHLARVDLRWEGEEASLEPGDQGFPALSRELLEATYRVENVERLSIPPNETQRLRAGSDHVEAVLDEPRRISPPDYDVERETGSILVAFSNTSPGSLAGKLLLCLEDHCSPFATQVDIPALRSAAQGTS